MLLMVVLFLVSLGLTAIAHVWVHGLARHHASRALGVPGTSLPLGTADRDAYRAAPLGRRLLAAAAGPVANYLLCALCFAVAFMTLGSSAPTTRVGAVVPGGPADQAGLRAGDRIVSVDDKPMSDSAEIAQAVRQRGAGALELQIERGGQTTPMKVEVRESRIGITFESQRRGADPGGAALQAAPEPARVLSSFYFSAKERHLAGPVGVAAFARNAPDPRQQVGLTLMGLATYTSVALPLSLVVAAVVTWPRRRKAYASAVR